MTDVLLLEEVGTGEHRRHSNTSTVRFLGLLIGSDSLSIVDTGGAIDVSAQQLKVADATGASNPASFGQLTTEATARAAADTTLTNNLSTETSNRASADTTLQNNINTEASSRASADTSLQTQITANGSAITAIQTVDTGLQTQITTNSNSITTLNTEMAAADAALTAIQADVPLEQIFAGNGSNVIFTATLFSWENDNTVLDLEVFVDGRRETQDQTGSSLKGYQKTSATVLTLTEAPEPGSEVVIRKLGTAAGLNPTAITVDPAPATPGGQHLGTLANPWAGVYLKDTVTSQVYLLKVTSGVLGVLEVP